MTKDNPTSKPLVKVYSTATCPFCHALMDWLEQNEIPYEEIDASGRSDIDVVPVTEIGEHRIVGFNRPAIKAALKEINE